MATSTERELLTAEEAADLLRLTPATIRKHAREGRLPAFRAPGSNKMLFKRADLLDLLEPIRAGDEPPPDVADALSRISYEPDQERAATIEGIRRGLEARGHISIEEFAREQRRKYGLPG